MPPTTIRPGDLLPLPGGTTAENVATLLAEIRLRLATDTGALGDGVTSPFPPLVPHDPVIPAATVLADLTQRARRPVPAGTAAVLRSSGSTSGHGHLIALSAAALSAGAHAGEAALGGPGRWVLALPTHHIAGFQILVRSVVTDTDPVLLDTSAGFDPHRLAEAVTQAADGERAYVSLVPTQLHRVLQAGPEALAALRSAAAILVGGAATAPSLQQAARSAGLPIVTSYGMTETCGGCAYDGLPLEGVRVRITGRAAQGPGRVEIAGSMLAAGYLDQLSDSAAAASAGAAATAGSGFTVDADGVRWLRTSDLGEIDEGRLRIVGRLDDVINTGGVKVSPGPVEDILSSVVGVAAVMVVGIPDDQWGQSVVAVLVPAVPEEPPSLEALRAAVRRKLGPAHAPRALVTTSELPVLGPGKSDRRAAAQLAEQTIAEEADADGHGR